jgi:autotransporter-associated beta strand protein
MPSFSLRRWLESIFSQSPPRPHRSHRTRQTVETLEDRLAPATFTWTGAGTDDLWSDRFNWQGNVAPTIAGADDLIFPAGAARLSNTNDFVAAQFKSITLLGGGYTLKGAEITLGTSAAGTGYLSARNPAGTANAIQLGIQMAGAIGNKQFFTVQSAGANLTISGAIGGATGVELTKDGAGTLILSADNSGFTGPITVSSGAVNIQHANALGAVTSGTTIQSTGQLQLQSVTGTINENLIINGAGPSNNGAIFNVAGNNALGGAIRMDSFTTIGVSGGTALDIAGTLSDLGAGQNLTKEGAGQLILSRANTYRGRTLINHGVVTMRDPLSLGQGGAASDTVVSSDLVGSASLQIENIDAARPGFTVAGEVLTVNGPGANSAGALNNVAGNNTWASFINLGSPPPSNSAVTINVTRPADTLTITGVIQDPNANVNWTKSGPGTLTLTAANTYRGTTTVASGVVIVRDSRALGTTAGGTTVSNGATLILETDTIVDSTAGNGTTKLTIAEPLTIDGAGVGGIGALVSSAGINVVSGAVRFAATGGTTIAVAPDLTPTADDNYFTNDESLTISGVISDTATPPALGPTLDKIGLGHLILTGANSYTGGTRIHEGWITAQNDRALGANQSAAEVLEGTALHLKALAPTGFVRLDKDLILTGTGIAHPNPKIDHMGALENIGGDNSIGSVTSYSGNIVLTSPSVGIGVELVSPTTAPNTFSRLVTFGMISGVDGGITKLGSRRLEINGPGAYEGDLDIQQGVVRLRNNTAVGADGGKTIVADGAAVEIANTMQTTAAPANGVQIARNELLILNGAGNTTADGTLVPSLSVVNGDHLWRGPITLGSDSTFGIAVNSRLLAYGAIDDGGNAFDLTKTGPGTLALYGINTYGGITTISQGIVAVQSSQAFGISDGTAATGTVVAAGASLNVQGNIVIAGEALEIQGSGTTTTSLVTSTWFEQGPSPIPNAGPGGLDVSGTVTSIVSDPTNPQILYLTGGDGSAWRSGDGGQTWATMFANGFGTIAVAPSDPRILYMGTGDIAAASAPSGSGVFKSTDGGKSWTLLQSPPGSVTAGEENPLRGVPINKIAVDPTNPNLIFVATNSTSNNGGTSGRGAVWRYTAAGWYSLTSPTPGLTPATPTDPTSDARVNGLPTPATVPGPDEDTTMDFPASGNFSDVIVTAAGLVYIALGETGGADENTVYHSDNAGTSMAPNWLISDGTQEVPDPNDPNMPPAMIANAGGGAPAAAGTPGVIPNGFNTMMRQNGLIRLGSSGDTVYASIVDPTNENILEIYSTTDGVAWTLLTTPPNYLGTTGNTLNAMAVDPADPNVVYVGGQSVLQSVDGGLTWTDITVDAAGAGPIPGIHSMNVDDQGHLIVGAEGGAFRYDPTVPEWTDLNDTLSLTAITGLDVDLNDADHIVAGAGAPGTIAALNGVWAQIHAGVAGPSLFDPTNPATIYREGNGNSLERSDDGGANWTPKNTGITGAGRPFFPYVIDSINPSRLLLGSNALFESTNRGDSWVNLGAALGQVVAIAPAVYQGTFVADTGFAAVTDLGAGAYNSDTIYLITPTAVRLTKNHGTTYVARTAGITPATNFADIAVDPRNRDTAYVVRGGTGGKVWRTTTAGLTWTNITGNLPDQPVSKIIVDAQTGDLYVGNATGVYRLTGANVAAGTSTWAKFGIGLPNVQVNDLVLNPNLRTLTAGTNGRGVYTMWLDPSQATPVVKAALLSVNGSPEWSGPIALAGNATIGAIGGQTTPHSPLNASLGIFGLIGDGDGAFDLTKLGKGDVTLGGANTYDGKTTVAEGALIARNALALGSATGESFVTDGASLEMQDSIASEILHLKGAGLTIDGHAAGALRNSSNFNTFGGQIILESDDPTIKKNVTIGVDSGSQLTVTGVITDGTAAMNLIKELTGTLILTNANTYDGLTTIVLGAIQVQNSAALGAATQGTVVADGGQLQLTGGLTITDEPLTLSGSGIFNTGALFNVAGNNAWTGPVTLTNIPGVSPITVPSSLIALGVANAADTLTVSGAIGQTPVPPATAFGLRKVLPGAVILSGNNTYTDLTQVEVGTLTITSNTALGTGAAGTTVFDGASLQVQGGITVTGEALRLSGSGVSGAGAVENVAGNNTWNGAVALDATSAVGVTAGLLSIRNGTVVAVSGPATSELRKIGAGEVELLGPNDYQGFTSVAAGILDIRDAKSLGAGTSGADGTLVASGATLQVQGGFTVSGEVLLLGGAGAAGTTGALESVAGNNTWAAPITLTSDASIGVAANTLTLPGAIDDALLSRSLVKNGPGTVAYTGTDANTYSGQTTVTDGALLLNKTGVRPFLGNLVVGDGLGVGNSAVVRNLQADEIPNATSVTLQSDGLLDLNNLGETLGSLLVVGGHVTTGATANLTLNDLTMVGGTIDLGSSGTSLTLALRSDVVASSDAVRPATIQGTGGAIDFAGANRTVIVNRGGVQPDLVINAPIIAATNLSKDGPGVLAIKADNPAYTGITSVFDGVLQVDGSLGRVSLANGSLGGSGTVGAVSATTFGTVNPGSATAAPFTGTLRTGPVTLNPISFARFDIVSPANHDLLAVNGNIELGLATIVGSVDPTIPLGVPIPVIQTTNGFVLGQFAQGLSAFIGGQKFAIDYTDSTKVVLTKVKNTATINIASNSSPSVFGQPLTLTVTVIPEPGAGPIPDGTHITLAATGAGPAFPALDLILTGGQATATFPSGGPQFNPTLNVGSHTFIATLASTTNFEPAVSQAFAQDVNKANTTVSFTTTPATPVFGQITTLTAHVAPFAPGAGAPTGTVTLTIDGVAQAPLTLDTNGNVSVTLPETFATGNHAIIAAYSGDAKFNGFDNTAAPFTLTIGKTGSAVTITASPPATIVNQTVTFTAAVVPSPVGAGIPSGTATFFDTINGTTTTLGAGTLDAFGVATFSTSALAGGTHLISVAYSGDVNFLPTDPPTVTPPNPITFVVNSGLVNISLISSGSPSIFGAPVTFTTTLTSAAPSPQIPTGTATFFIDGVQQGDPVPLNGAAQATFTASTLSATNHLITVNYSGDPNFNQATTSIIQSVLQGSATISVATSVLPSSEYGQSVSFTASVAPVLPATIVPTGTVTFSIDGVPQLPAVPVDLNGNAVLSLATLIPATHEISAIFNGDVNYVPTNIGAVAHTVVKGSIAVDVVSSAPVAAFGQPVTFTATMTPGMTGGLPPSGFVAFLVNGAQRGAPVAVDSTGKAAITLGSLPVGTPSIVAQYSGDTNYTGRASAAFSQTVNAAASTANLSSNGPSFIYGNDIVTAQIASAIPGGVTPTGSVTFTLTSAGGPITLTAPLIAGVATMPHPNVGLYTSIVANYTGDYAPSTSNAIGPLNISPAATNMTFTPSVSPSGFAGPVTFTATVTSPNSPLTPAGDVTFIIDGSSAAVVPLNTSGVATYSTSTLSPGNHNVIASFANAQGNFSFVSKSLNPFVVNPAVTTTTLTPQPSVTLYGEPITITATVAAVAPAGGVPPGTVTFSIDGVPQAPVTLNAQGKAVFTSGTVDVGARTIVATYSGAPAYNASTSTAGTLTVNPGQTTTTLSSSANPGAFGEPIIITATVAPVSPAAGTPSGSVVFTFNGVPQAPVNLVGGEATLALAQNLTVAGSPYTVSAAYTSSNGNFLGSSGTLTGGQVIQAAETSIAVISTDNPSTFFAPITLTATVAAVSPGTATPSGTLEFFDGTTSLGAPITVNSAGVATLDITGLAVSPPTHAITAVFTPDSENFLADTSPVFNQVVNKGITTVSINSTANPGIFSEPTITAIIDVPAGAPPAAGIVTFNVTGATTFVVTLPVSAGVATLTTPLNVGDSTITATYGGDGNFAPSISPDFIQTITKAESTTMLTSSLAAGAVYGQSVIFTATVVPTSPSPVAPEGSVVFTVNGVPQTPIALAGGQAQITLTNLPVSATNTVFADFSSTNNLNASTSATLTQAVSKANTTVTITATPNPAIATQAVTFTASVDPVAPGGNTPTGSVVFVVDGVAQPAVALNNAGKAILTQAFTSAGNHTIVASYASSTNYNGSVSSSFIQTVTPHRLAFTTVPTTVNSSALFTIVVKYFIPGSTTVDTSFNGPVTLALNSGPPGGSFPTLVGNAVSGVATFSGLSIARFGAYALQASVAGLPPVIATVNVGPSVLSGFLSASQVAANIGVNLTVNAFDSLGNLATNYTAPVSIVIISAPAGGAITGGNGTITNGSTTLAGVRFTKQGNYTFSVVSGGLSFTLSITVSGRLT